MLGILLGQVIISRAHLGQERMQVQLILCLFV